MQVYYSRTDVLENNLRYLYVTACLILQIWSNIFCRICKKQIIIIIKKQQGKKTDYLWSCK